jgi:hypothetical protein
MKHRGWAERTAFIQGRPIIASRQGRQELGLGEYTRMWAWGPTVAAPGRWEPKAPHPALPGHWDSGGGTESLMYPPTVTLLSPPPSHLTGYLMQKGSWEEAQEEQKHWEWALALNNLANPPVPLV